MKTCSLTARFKLILKIQMLQNKAKKKQKNDFVLFIFKGFELIKKIRKLKLACNCFVPFN